MIKNKIKLGIDINEVLRCRWLMFDRYYFEDFGDKGIPKDENGNIKYSYDLFNSYIFEDTVETTKLLNKDLPDDIKPQDYQIDPESGEAPVDSLAFRKETRKLTALDMFNRFMYQDYLLEIHGLAPLMYKGLDQDLQKFYQKYSESVEFVIVSKENSLTIPPTLFFLSKLMFRARKYFLVETNEEIWNEVDILVTTDPELLNNVPENKIAIKANRPYNEEIKLDFEILQINDLFENENFEKIINYKKENI